MKSLMQREEEKKRSEIGKNKQISNEKKWYRRTKRRMNRQGNLGEEEAVLMEFCPSGVFL